MPSDLVDSEQVQEDPEMLIDGVGKGKEGFSVNHSGPQPPPEPDSDFGPWLKPRKKHVASRGRGGSRVGGPGGSRGGSQGGARPPSSGASRGDDDLDPDAWPPA